MRYQIPEGEYSYVLKPTGNGPIRAHPNMGRRSPPDSDQHSSSAAMTALATSAVPSRPPNSHGLRYAYRVR